MEGNNASVILVKFLYWSRIFASLRDEDNMAGRQLWALVKQRIEEFRNVNIEIDDDFNVHTMYHKLTHPKLSTSIYCGIPAFYWTKGIRRIPEIVISCRVRQILEELTSSPRDPRS